MEKQIIFRDYQEQQAQDHNDLQLFARTSLDHLVSDVVTTTRKYSGFGVVKTAQSEVQIAPGRFYDLSGAVFNLSSVTVQSMLSLLPSTAKRIITISAYGVTNETDIEERDYLVDVTTGRTEPRAMATVSSRDAVLTLTNGAESADPQAPSIPISNAKICDVLLDPLSVVSVTMYPEFEVSSVEDLDSRLGTVETFDAMIGPRVTSLASDLAALAAKANSSAQKIDVVTLYRDLAEVKEKVGLPAAYAQYGADYFLQDTQSDSGNTTLLGYDALVEMGARFPAANANIFEISLFSANDQNAHYQSGLLLPAFTSIVKLSIGPYHDDIGIAQYGYQTFEMVQVTIHKERLRYGGEYSVCSNGATQWNAVGEQAPYWLPNYATYQTTTVTGGGGGHTWTNYDYWWHDSWTESYWELEVINHAISGAQVAQTFLNANDMWATRLGFYITAKGGAENIIVSLCEVTNGMPDTSRVISHQVYDQSSIVVGWNHIDIVPTFLDRGKRYAILLTSNANHRVGMAYGQSYLDGTFFYSTDGVYYLGDLIRDMMIEVWGARFNASQVTIEFAPINLDGGFRDIDITAGTIVPASCQLIYEMRPNGTGEWQGLTLDNLQVLTNAPPLCQFRARFVGTQDVQAGLQITGSRVYVSRPKIAFKHVSTMMHLGAPSTEIHVVAQIEHYDEIPHDITCALHIGTGEEIADTVTTTVVDLGMKRYKREWVFTPALTTDFQIEFVGTSNSPANLFHIGERLYYAL